MEKNKINKMKKCPEIQMTTTTTPKKKTQKKKTKEKMKEM